MGLGMQLTGWPDELVELLLGHGFRVLRFDNRDAGLSDGFDHVGVPSIPLNALRHFLRLPIRSPYALKDMAADAVGVLDALGIARAHVVGASLGGMIAQHVAATYPERVASVTLIMTTSDGGATRAVVAAREPRTGHADLAFDQRVHRDRESGLAARARGLAPTRRGEHRACVAPGRFGSPTAGDRG
jgi:pimeloyl-ACP methyl ester carboxylesterase